MTLFYLDTSAWIKRYVAEAGHERIEAVFAAGASRASSALGYVEAHAALARRDRQGLDASAFRQALSDLGRDWIDFLSVRVSDTVVEQARGLAVNFGLRGADAIHLASALALRRRRPRAYASYIFAAADRELLATADLVGLETWNPEDELQAV